MSKFNKQSKGKFSTRPELKRSVSIPMSEMSTTFNIQNRKESTPHLKDTVRKIIDQIREEKQKSNGSKPSFKDVVHNLMKNKSRVYNENVLKLAKSVVISQQIQPTDETPPPIIMSEENIQILQTDYNRHSSNNNDSFTMDNPMSITFHPVKQKIRFGDALNNNVMNDVIKGLINLNTK